MASGLSIQCPTCGAQPYQRCKKSGPLPHKERIDLEANPKILAVSKPTKLNKKGELVIEVVNFIYEKSTPGSYRFKECDDKGELKRDGYVIGTLYLRKILIGDNPPQRLKVTIETQ